MKWKAEMNPPLVLFMVRVCFIGMKSMREMWRPRNLTKAFWTRRQESCSFFGGG